MAANRPGEFFVTRYPSGDRMHFGKRLLCFVK
jgi:hypothetical protein